MTDAFTQLRKRGARDGTRHRLVAATCMRTSANRYVHAGTGLII
jgi:hypothetical protein